MYRGTWLLVGVPLLVAAFSVGRPEPLPPSPLPPTFDGAAAVALATDLARRYPDRSPGSPGAAGAARWFAERLRPYGFRAEREVFTANIAGKGRVRLVNLVTRVTGRSPDLIVVLAHRDNVGTSPGANDNASGTAALIELARAYAPVPAGRPAAGPIVRPAHTLVFLSTDGGAYGAVGAARFARDPANLGRIVAAINLDAPAGFGLPRLQIAGDEPRSPAPELVQTAAARVLEQTGSRPERPSALRQLIDLAFPFSLYEQAPFVALGVPAVTLTTSGDRPPQAFAGASDRVNARRLQDLGLSAQSLLSSLHQGAALGRASGGYVYLGPRIVRGWAIQLVLIAALLPFLAAVVDLFARCRRRRIALAPALRSYRSRLGFWLFVGTLFALLHAAGAWPDGETRPPAPETAAAGDWALLSLGVLAVAAALAWLVARERLLPRRAVTTEDELAGATAALLVLAVLALVVIAFNAYALLFLLPSLHAWLWLPQVRKRHAARRLAVLAGGMAGPLLLLASFALRFGLGLDAPWYLLVLTSVGYVEPPAVVLSVVWLAVAGQMTAVAAGRYAPYPTAAERGPRGPLRNAVRRGVVAVRRRRAADDGVAALEG